MSLLQMSFYGAILILVIIFIRTLMIHKLPKRFFLLLWSIALLRLLVPFEIPSAFSVYSFLPVEQTPPIVAAQTPLSEDEFGNIPLPDFTGTTVALQDTTDSAFSIRILPLIWCIGTLACFFWFSISYLHCYTEFQTSLPVSHPALTNWLNTHPLKRSITIRMSDRFSTPLTYGILRPVILLPTTTNLTNTEQLHYILQHEYHHIQRFDTLRKLFMTIALCLHWFNPLVWAMSVLFNRDIELTCDNQVVKTLGTTSKASYARALIAMEETHSGFSPIYNSFSKNSIEERIKAIMKTKKTTRIAILFSTLLLLAIVVFFCTGAKQYNTTDGSYAAMVKGCTENTLLLDFVEYVTDDDTERKAELIKELQLEEGIDLIDGNFPNGYYIYDSDSGKIECSVASNVLIQLINYEAQPGDPSYSTTSDLAVLLDRIFSEYGWSAMPYFFEIENGVITQIQEKFIP